MNIIRSAVTVYSGLLLVMTAGHADAYSDYVNYTDVVAIRDTVTWPYPSQAEIDMTLERVQHAASTENDEAPGRRIRTEPTILLLLGLGMSGLALWGRKKHQPA